jgi:hypothetical protein
LEFTQTLFFIGQKTNTDGGGVITKGRKHATREKLLNFIGKISLANIEKGIK